MKKLIYLSLAVMLMSVAHVASAQVQLAIGIKGGPNFASLNTTSSVKDNYNNRTGFHAGGYVMFKFTKLAIQPEILFSQNGHTVKVNTTNYKENYSYVNIPIMVKLYLIGGLNLQAGPQFGFLTGAKGPSYNVSTNTLSSAADIKSLAKSSDISASFGVGWDLPFGLNVGARYNLGLSNINKNAGNSSANVQTAMGTDQAKNQVFQFSVGYRLFKIGS